LDKAQRAIQLAQKYKDFTTIVRLSSDDERVINDYIVKYQQEFANALFQWYMDNGTELFFPYTGPSAVLWCLRSLWNTS
jgi:hypothetical protein